MVNRLPLAGGAQTGAIEFEGMDPTAVTLKNVDYRSVTPDYFRAIGIPLVSGRAFVDTDREEAAGVAIIDERLAREFGDRSPLGHRVRIPYGNLPWLSIVGVVGHIRHDRLEEDTRPQIYFPFVQRAQDRMALVVRTRTDPGSIGAALASAIRSVDPEQPVYDARTLDEVVDRSMGQRWMQSALLGGFAAMAVLLAAIGVYGVIVYSVGQRQREFGIRLALGARRGEIVELVIGRGLVLFAIGAGAGVAAAVLTGRALSSLLFAVTSFDAASFGIATLVLLVVSLAACGLPARKAAGVDPSLALRAE
jgi:putative ABC transport system permease protein